MDKVNLLQKFAQINEHWSPKVVGELNGQQVKLARLKGAFVWHHHEAEDEAFFVLKGSLRMELRDKAIVLNEGDMLIVPRGVEHKPVADEEVWIMLFEPATTLNTGNVVNERTRNELERI
jgi:mannose-6-phosphate isomerase-like protein (cupin superfamily)